MDRLDGVEGRGRAFVQDCWQSFGEWTAQSLLLLREAGLLISQLDAQRGTPAERGTQRMLLSVLSALRLPEA